MSCQSCTRPAQQSSSDVDVFSQCPPRMSDGRHFTDYRPKCFQQYLVNNKLMSSFEQRLYLTRNAEYLMKKNAADAYQLNRCGPCVEPYDEGTMLPEQVTQVCNSKVCSFNPTNPYGLGLGREFILSEHDKEFRAKFLAEKEKEQAYFKADVEKVNPRAIDPEYFPIGGMLTTEYDRFAVPSGAMPFGK